MESINGVTCIKGEIHSIMTLMRLNSRCSQSSKGNNETASLLQDQNPLVISFRLLNEYLEGIFDLKEVDCVTYITPFHQVIISDRASGTLTSAALSSLSKFALYGFLRADFPRVREGMSLIANCIAKCVFEETDWESDEVILMKLLELSALSLRCDASNLLTVGAAWDIYSTCISIHSPRTSKILRSEAESTLRHLTLTAFSKIHYALSKYSISDDNAVSTFFSNGFQNQSWETICQQMDFAGPIGVTLLLGKIMTVLSSLMDLQNRSLEEVQFALSLVNIALEAGGPTLGELGPLVDVLRGDVCRHLLRASQSDDLAIFSLALRVVFNLFVSIKDHMKVQLEVFFSSVHLRLLHNQQVAIYSAKEELALESLLEFCREPSLMYDLYANYDCDVQCTNLFDSIIMTLCTRAVPAMFLNYITTDNFNFHAEDSLIVRYINSTSGNSTNDVRNVDRVGVINKLALDGVFAILHTVALRCAAVDISNDVKSATDGKMQHAVSNGDLDVETPCCNAANDMYADTSATPQVLVAQQVDQWCSSEPGTPPGLDPVVEQPHCIELKPSSPFNSTDRFESSHDSSSAIAPVATIVAATSFTNINTEESDFVYLARAQTSEVLRERKLRKQRLRVISEKFNATPLKSEWIKLSIELNVILPHIPSASIQPNDSNNYLLISKSDNIYVDSISIAKFLKNTPGLGKSQVGEYISKGPAEMYPFHANVLRAYVDTFDFNEKNNKSFDKSLRTFLGHFRLPGEAQCIDRLMEAFASKLFESLGPNKPFASADAAFILSFSTIMLNTDLHNPNLAQNRRMTKEQFVRNNRKINDGQDLPLAYLESLYDEIKSKQIQVDIGINDNDSSNHLIDYTDTVTWNKLLRKSAASQAPAAFTPTVAARRATTSGGRAMSWIPLSIEEKDMFHVMAKPVIDTMLTVWEISNNDQVIRRVLEGIWDYTGVCIGLDMPSTLNGMLSLLTVRTRLTLDVVRQPYKSSSRATRDYTYIETQIYRLNKSGCKYDMYALINSEFSSFVSLHRGRGGATNASKYKSVMDFNWNGAHIIKGELMLKTLFYVVHKFMHCIDSSTWNEIIKLLLFIRSRGLLPRQLATIMDINHDTIDYHLNLSIYALRCITLAQGNEAPDSNHQDKQTWWSWLAPGSKSEFEDLLLATSTNTSSHYGKQSGTDGSTIGHGEIDGNACIYNTQLSTITNSIKMQSLSGSNANGSSSGNDPDTLLRTSVSSCKVDELMISMTVTYDEEVLKMIFNTILSHISSITTHLLDDNKPSNHSRRSASACEGGELAAVVLLEWLCKIIIINRDRYYVLWPSIHTFLQQVFDDSTDSFAMHAPFFLERCIVLILRVARETSLVMDYSTSSASSSCTFGSYSELKLVWLSFRLLRSIPSDIVANIADRIAIGVLSLIQHNHTIDVEFTLEQWYMIFSLLSASTSGCAGRIYVWDAITYLMENNLIMSSNFMSCRHLVLRFLHEAYPDGATDTSTAHEGQASRWMLQSLEYLMRLTLMTFGCYSSSNSSSAIDDVGATTAIDTNSGSASPVGKCSSKLMTFPLPQAGRILMSPSPAERVSSSVSVSAVKLASPEEVEALWLESCKAFADKTNIMVLSIVNQSVYCIQSIFISGNIAGLPDDLWFRALFELITRLPINLATLEQRFVSDYDTDDLLEGCLRCCNVIFETIVIQLVKLRGIKDFPTLWLKFISTLAMNANSLTKGSSMHNEMIEMIAALLRLLRPPALPHSVINSPVSQAAPAGSTGIFAIIASALFNEQLPSPQPVPAAAASSGMSPATTASGVTGASSIINGNAFTTSGGITGNEHDDVALLSLSWKNICSICPALQSSLRQRHSQLVADLLRHMDINSNSTRQMQPQQQSQQQPQQQPQQLTSSTNISTSSSTNDTDKASAKMSHSAKTSRTLIV